MYLLFCLSYVDFLRCFAMFEFLVVKCSLTYTLSLGLFSVSFNFCLFIRTAIFAFLLVKRTTIGLVFEVSMVGKVWHADIELCSMGIPLDCKKSTTWFSRLPLFSSLAFSSISFGL